MNAGFKYTMLLMTALVFFIRPVSARLNPDKSEVDGADTLSGSKELMKKAGELTDIYGSLRFKVGYAFSGETGIQDDASRMGIKGVIPVINGIDAILQLEVGVGMVGNKTQIKFNGDPGGAVGEVDNVFSSRLGYVGIKTKFGQLTWGKQWSAYSDIGGQTDMYNAFGAEASGTYSAGTDGAISGSGRASNCFQYRLYSKYLETTLQVQNRNITDSTTFWADTYGISLILKPLSVLKFGAAYNKVRDGIQNPSVYKPKYGDDAWSTMIFYNSKPFNAIFTASIFNNHEKDNLGNYFSGYGLELYCEYRFNDHWRFYGGFNNLQAQNNSIAAEYCIQYIDIGSFYAFGRSSKLFLEARLDDSRNNDGSHSRLSAIAFGMFFDFYY